MILIKCSVCGAENRMHYAGSVIVPAPAQHATVQLHSLPVGWYDAGTTGHGPVCSKECLRAEIRRELNECEAAELNLTLEQEDEKEL